MIEGNRDKNPSEEEEKRPPRSLPELVSLSIASFILAAVVGLVLYDWFSQKAQPPILAVTPNSEIRQAQGQFYIPFKITNTGGDTAESVQIIAELRINGKIEETGEQQIDFISGGETQEGAFVFSRDPRKGELLVRVASYKLP